MLAGQRKRLLLDVLHRDGQIVAKTLSRELDLSEDTIRRDLRELAREGRLQRVHGGALPASLAVVALGNRRVIAADAKSAIGRAAATLIEPGQIVMVDGGTTTAQLVRHLAPDLTATIVTHSPTIAAALIDHPTIEVIVIGGRLFKHSGVATGAAAAAAIARIRADTYFMGATGLRPDIGATTGDAEEADIKRALCASASETIVLASTEKLNAASPFLVVPLDEITGIVVAHDAPDALIAPYAQRGLTITRAARP